MEVIIVILVLVIILFITSFMHGKKFGLMGLALAAGSILNGIWAYDVGLIASGLGLTYSPLTKLIIELSITFLPAIILLFHGDAYKAFIPRLVGAGLFSFLSIAFLVDPLGYVFMPQGVGADLYDWLLNNKNLIIGVGLMIAVIDLFFTRPIYQSGKTHKH